MALNHWVTYPPLALRIKVFRLIIVPLCPNYLQFIFLYSVHDALTKPKWKDAMIEEMTVTHRNITRRYTSSMVIQKEVYMDVPPSSRSISTYKKVCSWRNHCTDWNNLAWLNGLAASCEPMDTCEHRVIRPFFNQALTSR